MQRSQFMGLLAHLCYKLHPVPEVLATEALAVLLSEAALGDALSKFIAAQIGGARQIPSRLKFKAQVAAEDKGRPDIVATGLDGLPLLILELKFWAALTANQPVGYLDRLSDSGVLVFIGPAIRHLPLWSELTRRVVDAGRRIETFARSDADVQVASVEGTPMVLVSWRRVLGVLLDAAAGDAACSSDIRQLSDLTEKMDTDAFLPLRQTSCRPRLADGGTNSERSSTTSHQPWSGTELVTERGR